MSGNNILTAGQTLEKLADINPVYTPCSSLTISTVKGAGNRIIFTNPVTSSVEIIRSDFRGIYDLERGCTEVGSEHDSEPMMKLAISA